MAAWRWISEGGLTVGTDGFVYSLREDVSAEERQLTAQRLALQSMVWTILYSARMMYAGGTADYRDAVESLSNLLPQLALAGDQLEKTVKLIESYFIPGDAAFKTVLAPTERMQIARETVEHLSVKK